MCVCENKEARLFVIWTDGFWSKANAIAREVKWSFLRKFLPRHQNKTVNNNIGYHQSNTRWDEKVPWRLLSEICKVKSLRMVLFIVKLGLALLIFLRPLLLVLPCLLENIFLMYTSGFHHYVRHKSFDISHLIFRNTFTTNAILVVRSNLKTLLTRWRLPLLHITNYRKVVN